MKLAAIYNVFDGLELLEGSIHQIRSHVDTVIVVSQEVSNFGEKDDSVYPFIDSLCHSGAVDVHSRYTPRRGLSALKHETEKRKIGVRIARDYYNTHYLLMDTDEYYDTQQFGDAKSHVERFGYDGSACSIWTYYKKPTLRFSKLDNYFVPFIHQLHVNTRIGGRIYPCKVDPTRGAVPVNKFLQIPSDMCAMHHFSYIRKDIKKKLRNSTARKMINIGNVIADYRRAEAGFFVSGFGQTLTEVPNKFNIDDFSIQSTDVFQPD